MLRIPLAWSAPTTSAVTPSTARFPAARSARCRPTLDSSIAGERLGQPDGQNRPTSLGCVNRPVTKRVENHLDDLVRIPGVVCSENEGVAEHGGIADAPLLTELDS